MTVCITEKPSVASDIARIIGASARKDGFFQGNGYQVTWALGHLCCLKEPEDYRQEWKTWDMTCLPMVPERFAIKVIDNPAVRKQYKIVESLFRNADCIINCGDAGQEGELIQRWIIQKSGVRCPVKRLWISSLTDSAIREGFRNLKPQDAYDNLYLAGLARACGDWLLGMNATRLFTIKYGNRQVLSIGRVQTPTLSLIVHRHEEIANFKPEKFYVIETAYKGVTFRCSDRFPSRQACEDALKTLHGKTFSILNVQKKDGREQPPQLFDLTSLQVECNNRYGWSADFSLNTLQSLYEKKLVTYPRVDTRYLPEDVYPICGSILSKLSQYEAYTRPLLSDTLRKGKRVFDSSKVTDHHAIIPTGQKPSALSAQQEKLFDLIVRRFITSFYPDCLFSATSVTGAVSGSKLPFMASGKTILSPGWRAMETDEKKNDEKDQANAVIPPMNIGESGHHFPKMIEKTTQPLKPFTEASLLQAMETAGKLATDATIKEAMKENGIGRPSSRAGIIETLFKRGFISREKKNLIPTATGIDLIHTIRFDLLKSVEMTGIWERKLRDIEKGCYDPALFIKELKDMLTSLVKSVKADASGHIVASNGAARTSDKKTTTYRRKKRKK